MDNIAFLGLGRMGSGMAERLARSGAHTLTVWNRNHDKAIPLRTLGARVAADPVNAIRGAGLVITCLLDDRAVEGLFHPGSAALAALRPGAIHLCVATISPFCADRLQALHAAHGTRYVSGPVVGRPDRAAAGKLIQFLAGDSTAISEVEPVCGAFAERVIPLAGAAGIANSQKLCINFFIAALIECMSECYTLGDKLGVSRPVLADFFKQCFAHPGFQAYADLLFRRETGSESGFAMTAGLKDVTLIREAAASVSCPVDIADIVATKMTEAIAQGMGQADWSATQEIGRQRARLK